MIMEGLASRSELRKELERERRRLRDRQRRQSMSHEEREKHLARRRRNYQLRRQRAETARLYTPPPPIQFQETKSISTIHSPLNNFVSSSSPQFNAAAVVDPHRGHERLMLETRSSQSLEIPVHKLAILPGKVRLNRIKHLARAINYPVCNGVAIGGMMKENRTSKCLVSKRLRLSRIKRIARSVNLIVRGTSSQNHQSITKDRQPFQ
ncbi:uncharacterized protein LOC120189975 isoform X1 [Hibiscus syriacus]|uniref:uncharacterized protein LOC120189975 isoform X1 n=2 Tax=Hibiscus syriacus TaxID=106335 RepID=UPI0019231A46|nr:uncharacterized protein LOC120189975 isoform X1 [Hibiscus syriacus]